MWQDGDGMRLGIDFGTTRTVVAFCDRGNYPVVNFLDEAGDASDCFPSVVAERQADLRFGFEAERLGADPEWTLLRSFKRLLGDRSPDAIIDVGSTSIRAVDLLTGYFTSLRDVLCTRSNIASLLHGGEPLEVFVAAPANAHSTQRFICLDAFRRAGFEVLGLLNEPSAANFEYTHRYRNTLTSKKDHIVVYDIEGGTFDASLLRMTGPLHEVVATAGINRLGGDDFDNELLELALRQAHIEHRSLSQRAERLLVDQCRHLKEHLHPTTRRISVDLSAGLGSGAARPTVEVDEFYARCAPLVDRTMAAMSTVFRRLGNGLASGPPASPPADALVSGRTASPPADDPLRLPNEIAGIYVVGGASSLPCVARALRENFGKRVHRSPYPSASAAIGLAIAADHDAGLRLSDRFSRVFGL